MPFDFATPTRVVFGGGTLDRIGALTRDVGRRALVVHGRSRTRADLVRERLDRERIEIASHAVAGEPDVAAIEKGVALAHAFGCDVVIGVGGGSVVDAAKAIAALVTNGGEPRDYLEVVGRGLALSKASLPCIAVPTTAGTGSEVTRNAVIASPGDRVKASLRSATMYPRIAVIDPRLAIDLPREITATTGLDALTQLIEPYVSSRASPFTDPLCLDGIQRVAAALRPACDDGSNLDAREQMAFASLLGGIALANAALGAVHGFAGPIGGMFGAPHGAVVAALLPHVVATNLRALRERGGSGAALDRFRHVAMRLTGRADATADAGVEWVRRLVNDLRVPPLGAHGVRREHVDEIVSLAVRASSMKGNPIELTREELSETLEGAI
jgi:alcohol dehydrogenase class IV